MLTDWKNAIKMASEDPQKTIVKKYKKTLKWSAFFSGLWNLNNPSY